jgi:DNA ligase-1
VAVSVVGEFMRQRFDAMASAKIFSGKPEEVPKNLALIKYPALVSIKYDGWRMFEFGGEVKLRSLKPPKNAWTQKVMRELFREAASLGVKGLDGEAIPGNPYDHNAMQACTSAFNCNYREIPFGFYVFDCYQYGDKPFADRLRYAADAVAALQNRGWLREQGAPVHVEAVEHSLVQNETELFIYYDEIILRGLEGVMGRDPRGPYKYGRSTMKESWLWALKPYVDDYAVITGYEEMLENQNELTTNERGYASRQGLKEFLVPKGTLGKFICRSPKFEKPFGVGMGVGLTFALRDEIWANRPAYLGGFMKYKYQEVGGKERPRQPKFMGLPHAVEIPMPDLVQLEKLRAEIFGAHKLVVGG